MCGILGGVNCRLDEANLARLHHRGPDQSAFISLNPTPDIQVCLGQTRLNIVDRNDITLPVCIDGHYIVMNGQIYNHDALRRELTSLGRRFTTRTDIEVALAAYLQWGPECLNRFNGMFALAIWDGEKFFCARDRMGEKPLYYRAGKQRFEFASEIKAFDKLEYCGHELFDLFEFCLNEHTLYRDVLALRPGHWLIYDLRKHTCHSRCYWDIEEHVGKNGTGDEAQAVNQFIELLEDSVRLRIQADAPVSMFLAGGLDSSLIAALSGVNEAFTCQFEEFKDTINEEVYATDLAHRLNIRLHMVRPTQAQFFTDLRNLGRHLEMPTGSFSAFPLYRLAAAARENGFKVVLSGEGSDELFAGYARNELLLSEILDPQSTKTAHYASMLKRYHGEPLDRFCRMASRSGLIGAGRLKTYLADHWSANRSTIQNMCRVEAGVFLQPLLQMADRMCMANSIENRCPYLDHRLVEFALGLDDSLRFRDSVGKWLVHRAAEKVLPRGSLVLTREVKDGLPTPVNQWLFGSHNFDRRHWNAMMLSECIRSLLQPNAVPLAAAQCDPYDIPMLVHRAPIHSELVHWSVTQ